MRHTALLSLLLVLTACQAPYRGDETSPYYPPPVGSRLVLKQELTIPDGHAGVSLQGGRVMRDVDVDRYRPSCRLEVNEVREATQRVAPDEFRVRRVRQETSTVAQTGVRLARLFAEDVAPTHFVYRTLLDLASARQPQVRFLVCQHWDDPALGRHLSIREIRTALGETIELVLPPHGAGATR